MEKIYAISKDEALIIGRLYEATPKDMETALRISDGSQIEGLFALQCSTILAGMKKEKFIYIVGDCSHLEARLSKSVMKFERRHDRQMKVEIIENDYINTYICYLSGTKITGMYIP